MDRQLSRRGFLAGAAVAGAVALAGAGGCAPSGSPAGAGGGPAGSSAGGKSFIGVGEGLKSQIKAAIRLSADSRAIEGVWVLEHNDSPFISDAGIEGITKAVVEQQSITVDTVSGATFTSMGVMQAVKNALEEGGVDTTPFEAASDVPVTAGEDTDCDILIIGGGAAGLTAAIAARTDDAMSPASDSGLKVVLVEQLAYTGGCIRVSDSILWAPNVNRYSEAVNQADQGSGDAIVAYAKAHPLFPGNFNEDLFKAVLGLLPTAFASLLDRGIYMPVSDAEPGLLGPRIDGPYWQVRNPVTDEAPFFKPVGGYTYTDNAGGPYLAQSLVYCAIDAGVDIRTSTKVIDLTITDGAIGSVKVLDRATHREYSIKPKQIIIATGAVGANLEMANGFDPSTVGAIHFGCAGTTGDGITWVTDNEGEVLPGFGHLVSGADSRLGHYGPCAILRDYAPRLTVNTKGERWFNEGAFSDKYTKYPPTANPDDMPPGPPDPVAMTPYLFTENNRGFCIMSGENAAKFKEQLDYAISRGVGWQADTVKELADAAGIDADGLAATVAKYNSDYAAGKGSDFGITYEQMTPIAESGPYYAFQQRTLCNLLDYGVRVNADCTPVKGDGSAVFTNARIAGSLMVANYDYLWGGASHATALVSGVYAGNLARRELKA
jgi:uncharacterized protein with FMN-binding domain